MSNAVTRSVQSIQTFLSEVKVELKKCTWPSRQELVESTLVVIVSMALLGVYVGFSDGVVIRLLQVIIR